jgi:hypothetical protein
MSAARVTALPDSRGRNIELGAAGQPIADARAYGRERLLLRGSPGRFAPAWSG